MLRTGQEVKTQLLAMEVSREVIHQRNTNPIKQIATNSNAHSTLGSVLHLLPICF